MKMVKPVVFVKKIENRYWKDNRYRKARDHCHYTRGNRDAANRLKGLAEEFKKQFTCLGENTEKYIIFIIEKEVTIIEKNGEEITKNLSGILQFIDRARFMASS